MVKRFALLTAALAAAAAALAATSTPTMGWSSWNTYRVNISDSLIMAQADALVASGLADAGYRYVNIDDGYFGGRDADGVLLAHPVRFPRGLRPVVDHIHSLGLKAGIYSDAGENTCGHFWDHDSIAEGVGLLGHEAADAQLLFADLGFDFIKIDFCGGDAAQNAGLLHLTEQDRYTAIARAIEAVGRGGDVRVNVCRWAFPGTWARDVASSWRISGDINPAWWSVRGIIERCLPLSAYAGGGAFNDMDMLEVGRGMTPDEDHTHFAMWCAMASPLLIGCDVTTMADSTRLLLANPELVAVNQDPLALQAYVADYDNGCWIVTRDLGSLHGTERLIALYNPTDEPRELEVDLAAAADLGGTVALRDLSARRDLPAVAEGARLMASLRPHATLMLRARGDRRLPRRRYEAETAYVADYQELRPGGAAYVRGEGLSGGFKATGLGGSAARSLTWHDVQAERRGRYRLTIACDGGEGRWMDVVVNGRPAARVRPDGAGRAVATVVLEEGSNVVTLVNERGAMPDIDVMVCEPR